MPWVPKVVFEQQKAIIDNLFVQLQMERGERKYLLDRIQTGNADRAHVLNVPPAPKDPSAPFAAELGGHRVLVKPVPGQ